MSHTAAKKRYKTTNWAQYNASLKDKMGVADTPTAAPSTARRKLRSIPVRVLFNDPDLNLRADYCMFDRSTARPLCVGNGESCKRVTDKVWKSWPALDRIHAGLAWAIASPMAA